MGKHLHHRPATNPQPTPAHLSRRSAPGAAQPNPTRHQPHQPRTPVLHAPKRAGPHTRTSPAATRPQTVDPTNPSVDPGLEAARIDHPRVVWLSRLECRGAINSTTVEVCYIMRALDPEVVDAVWAAIEPRVPVPADSGSGRGHRPRIADRVCFWGILVRLVTGCSWVTAERLLGGVVSDTTLRARRDEWIAAGVFAELEAEAVAGYDRVMGLDLSETSVDGSMHKAPCGGAGTGKSPVDRGKLGWKWSILTDRSGIPVAAAIDGANRHDQALFPATLEAAAERGLLCNVETLHLDRGYDSGAVRRLCSESGIDDVVCAKKRRPGTLSTTQSVPLGVTTRDSICSWRDMNILWGVGNV